MRKKILKIINFIQEFKNYVEGDFAYKNYCNHIKNKHPNQKILDKKTFLLNCQKQKWNSVNRCC